MANDTRLKAAGIRMALKLLPSDMLQQAPAMLEKFLLNQLADVEPDSNEFGVCYLIAPNNDTGALRILLCTLDEQSTVQRIVKETSFSQLFREILEGMKEI